jgi:hypothetical protein
MSDPSILASLHSTLTSAGLMGQLQAAQDAQQAELHKSASEAAAASTAAGAQYQQAAAAPTPQVDPLSQMLQTITGSIGSTLTKDPGYMNRAHASLTQQHNDLMTARIQNLQALKDGWDVKASAAEAAGNLEDTITARTTSEKLAKVQADLLETQREQAAHTEGRLKASDELANIAAQGRNSANVARINASARAGGGAADEVAMNAVYKQNSFTSPGGEQLLDLTPFKGKEQAAAMVWAAQNGARAIPGPEAERLKSAKEVLLDMDNIMSAAKIILPTVKGMNWGQAWKTKTLAGVANSLNAAAGRGPAASFGNAQIVGIRNIQALAAGAGSGFRLNVQEVNMMKQNWPKANDSIEQATDKLAWEKSFLLNKENAYLGKPPVPMPEMSWDTAPTKGGKKVQRYDANGNQIGGQ